MNKDNISPEEALEIVLKQKARAKEYYLLNKEIAKARTEKWRRENPAAARAIREKWREKNLDKVTAYQRAYWIKYKRKLKLKKGVL
jgi:hypothetical protein